MHIPPHDNNNVPIIDRNNSQVPLTYFNIVKLKKSERFSYSIDGYESCVVPATGTIDLVLENRVIEALGRRSLNVWDEEPEGVYVPTGQTAEIICLSDSCEVFIAGAKFDQTLEPIVIRSTDIDLVQYGSDETKTHRKIKHILGQKQAGRVGRLLVSELYTVGQGGWSGFPPHKHDTNRLPDETRHDEVYNFRFKPENGFGMQLLQPEDGSAGDAFHITNSSSFAIPAGYHPCVV
ncbi:5-deoxy-glucuronate isomerase, partial [Alphaproteobacteria bacterium]|nr:5-deoxy-glucuronate isomerase [Alphaproteobacteria bacterium]